MEIEINKNNVRALEKAYVNRNKEFYGDLSFREYSEVFVNSLFFKLLLE